MTVQHSEQIRLTPKGEAYAVANMRPAGCPSGIDPAAWRRAIEARAETLLDMVAALMATLDQMDGDAEAEVDTDDEDVDEDATEIDRGELDTSDDEWSLGWGDSMCQGLGIMTAGRHDQEATGPEWEPRDGAPCQGVADLSFAPHDQAAIAKPVI
jgi:hypothetical protein